MREIQRGMKELCSGCRGRGWCGRACPILLSIKQFLPKKEMHFSGASPPEIFIGRYGYPNINTGILAPQQHEKTEEFSSSEIWVKDNYDIKKILELRGKLIYGNFKSNIKDARIGKKFVSVMQELALSNKSVSTEFFLKKPINLRLTLDKYSPVIGNPAPLNQVRLEENPQVERKVEYIAGDDEMKAVDGIQELYHSNISVEHIIKLLSAGLLGMKKNRTLVPTRWAITAVDDSLSKQMLKEIRTFQEISDILVFNEEYVGNHYEFILLPDKFSFEVIEAKMSGSIWNQTNHETDFMQDYENFNGRKKYAENVAGGYYVARLAVCEYLKKIRKQASCLVLREASPDYWAPLGVGILREVSRKAFLNQPEKFDDIKDVLSKIQKRIKTPLEDFKRHSELLKNYKKQKKISDFFKPTK